MPGSTDGGSAPPAGGGQSEMEAGAVATGLGVLCEACPSGAPTFTHVASDGVPAALRPNTMCQPGISRFWLAVIVNFPAVTANCTRRWFMSTECVTAAGATIATFTMPVPTAYCCP